MTLLEVKRAALAYLAATLEEDETVAVGFEKESEQDQIVIRKYWDDMGSTFYAEDSIDLKAGMRPAAITSACCAGVST